MQNLFERKGRVIMSKNIVEIIDEYRRLGIDQQIDYAKFYLYSIITHSTAIEGSTVSEVENRLLFDEGIGAQITEHRKSKKKNDPIKSSQKTSQKTSLKILNLIQQNPDITTLEMADNIGIDRRNITRNIKKLVEGGFIKRVGPDKGGHWEVIPQK